MRGSPSAPQKASRPGSFRFRSMVHTASTAWRGTPACSSTCWQWKKWFDEPAPCPLGGKLGAVFATANFAQGGADIALQTLLCHMLVKGMLVYSGGGACGSPYTHLGAVALRENFEESKALFRIFGERVARKALELFPEGK